MSRTGRYEIDMCEGALAPKIIQFALPVMLASIIQLLFNAADVVVVGKFVGDASQAAVTSTSSVVNLMVGLFTGLGIGVNVIVAKALGSGEKGQISAVVHTSIMLGIVTGLFLTVVGAVFAPMIVRLMGAPESVIDLSVLYLRIYFLGLPGGMVYSFGSALMRAQGDTKRPMYFLTFAGVINVVLNLIFVVFFHWDVAGVAAATAISKIVSALLVLWCLMQEDGLLHLDLSRLRMDWAVVKEVARIGLPAGLRGTLFSLANVTLQSATNSMGETVMAASGAATSITGFVYVTGNAFYSAAVTFTSQNYGAGKAKRVDRTAGLCVLFGMLFPLVLGVGSYVFGGPLMGLYTNDPEVVRVGVIKLAILGIPYFLCGFLEVGSGVMSGLGYSMLPTVVTFVGSCGLRILWTLTVFPLYRTPTSLYICVPISWLITGIAHWSCFAVVRRKVYAKLRPGSEELQDI